MHFKSIRIVAWYQADAASAKIGTVTTDNTGSTISVADPDVSDVNVALPLNAVVAKVGNDPVEFAHYFGANAWASENAGAGVTTRSGSTINTGVKTNGAGLYTAYHDATAAKGLIYNATANTAFGGGNVLYRIFSVTLSAPSDGATIGGVHYSQLEIANKLNGRTAKISFSSSSRALYIPATNSTTATIQAGADSATFTKALSGIYVADADAEEEGNQPGVADVVAYFGVYVEGDKAGTVDTTPGAQTFTISIEDNSNDY